MKNEKEKNKLNFVDFLCKKFHKIIYEKSTKYILIDINFLEKETKDLQITNEKGNKIYIDIFTVLAEATEKQIY